MCGHRQAVQVGFLASRFRELIKFETDGPHGKGCKWRMRSLQSSFGSRLPQLPWMAVVWPPDVLATQLPAGISDPGVGIPAFICSQLALVLLTLVLEATASSFSCVISAFAFAMFLRSSQTSLFRFLRNREQVARVIALISVRADPGAPFYNLISLPVKRGSYRFTYLTELLCASDSTLCAAANTVHGR